MSQPNYVKLACLADQVVTPWPLRELLIQASQLQSTGIEPDEELVDRIRSYAIEFRFPLS
jgi:hypothetical protein